MSQLSGKAFDFKLFRRTFAFAFVYKKTLVTTALLTIGVAFLAPLRPLLIQHTIDEYIMVYDQEGLLRMILVLVGLLIFEAVLQFRQTYLASWLGQNVIKDLRMKAYQKIIGLKSCFVWRGYLHRPRELTAE